MKGIKSMKLQTEFPRKINRTDIFLVRLTNEKIEKTHIANTGYERGAITAAPIAVKTIVRGYSEHVHANNFNILDERHKLPQLAQEGIAGIALYLCIY